MLATSFWDNANLDAWEIPFGLWIEEIVFWLTTHIKGFLDAVKWPVDKLLELIIDNLLQDWLPWPVVLLLFFVLGVVTRNILVGLFSPDAGLVATFDGLGLTAIRTAAATALAVRHLAPPGATTAAVFGTGNQSRPHVQALAQELPLKDLRVWGRNLDKAEQVAAWGRERGIPARAVADSDEAVEGARVVATVTSSYTPVFDGSLLDPAALVCAVGSTKADRQEVDGTTVERAGFVVSDSAEGALTEAGDLIHAAADGLFDWDNLADLADVIAGTVTPPQPGSGIVLFESQGVALQDVVIATLAYQRSVAS